MKKNTWLIAITLLLVIGITGTLYLLSHPPKQDQQNGARGLSAITFKVTREDLVNTVEVKGKSSYQKETYINAPFSADVQSWGVSEGMQIAKGDNLFQLDDTALRDEIAQIQSNQKKTEIDIRISQFQQEATNGADPQTAGISETEAKQRYAQSQSKKMQEEINQLNIEHMQTQLAQKQEKRKAAQFNAPENGIFLFEGTKEPQSVKENERIGKIVDLTKLQLICLVGEYDLFRIKPDMPAEIKVDALRNTVLQGKVEKLSKFAKNGNSGDSNSTTAAQFEVIISLEPNDQLIADLSLTATIHADKKPDALVVHTLAIQRDKEQYYVMKDAGQGVAVRQDITIGMETPEKTEILSGLVEGDTVILE
ncbi:efflux RND transporter periplasmic adaptor subunit [Paenibacillus agricola]|uniref:HlyD family efflux transporter periplasmic adaptor subunit n=1 Tax=Paenibacillus agricola TaxID=2716264 RepID=A0ABX0JC74_9BACL|nr:efflux RND transporter periplasmic adaptor subunit [Paenibacillus agricola]NHN31275.1 HlyD family efflux transporter periplasmic adaptor subunit [Paenibacillus agricola]